jgi:molybdopterin-guanine dinucleotide biosynthesis protein A
MGGVDKGLQLLRGKAMVEWVLARFAPQVDEVLINANQNLGEYRRFGPRVVPDTYREMSAGYAGPLAGLQAGLKAAQHSLVVTCPCDSPFLPADLVQRLREALDREAADLAVAKTGDQPHPVFSLCRRNVLPSLTKFLESGGRKIDAWYASLKTIEVSFDDEAEAFSNINTREELQAWDSVPPG